MSARILPFPKHRKSLRPVGLDWARVRWARPDEPPPARCSVCGASLPDESDEPEAPFALRLWNREGYACAFCANCQTKYWGLHR